MKKILVIAAMLSVALLTGGCDFFRELAGRPTSEDIARKKAILDAKETAVVEQKAKEDDKAEKDSLAVMQAIAAKPSLLTPSSKMSASVGRSLPAYCIMVGAFGNIDNASALAARIEAAGYRSVLLPYNSGMTAVGVNPTNSIVDAYTALCKMIEAGLCPADAWILDNR